MIYKCKKFKWLLFGNKGLLYVEERKHISTYNHFVKHRMILEKGLVMEGDEKIPSHEERVEKSERRNREVGCDLLSEVSEN